jgi:1-aminocyclopropane-1-carboxylate deaminase
MAHACKTMGLSAVGIVRGEAPDILSHTLREAISYGMEPVFVPRSNYKNKALLQKELDQPNWYWIEEGGYGLKGAEGAATILDTVDKENYTDIICAVGTGTMMAGLVKSINANQRVTGISVLKNHHSVLKEVNALLNDSDQSKTYSVVPGYHFGGYAKHPDQLIDFMNECWKEQKIPTDIVYTSKLLFAVRDLIKQHYFKPASKLLIIHSGGLQGNYSLPAGKLIF